MCLVEFEVLEPATIQFPEDVRQLLVLNLLPQTHNFLDSSAVARLTHEQLIIIDTIITKNVFLGLYDVLKHSPIEWFQFPTWHVERQSDLLARSEIKLTKKEVIDLCNQKYSDAIVGLESCKLDIKFVGKAWTDEVSYSNVYQSILSTGWVLYLPANPTPFYEYLLVDSLYHIHVSDDPLVSEMIRNNSFENGSKFGRMLTPFWKRAVRNIYSGGNSGLRSATRQTNKGNWDEALSDWSKVADSGDSTDMAKALYNISVYYELEDSLDSASYFINRAVACDSLTPIKEYKEEIDQRIQNKQTILKQVERARLYRVQ